MTPSLSATLAQQIRGAVDQQRLVDTAVALVEVPSPTRSAGAVADCLEALLAADGFAVERPVAGWPEAPAVVARLHSGKPGRTLQFDGHLDTVHLPFAPPRLEAGCLCGSGAADMKGGIAAAVEALRVLRDLGALAAGGVLLTAHDHHESPWGDRRQVHALIAAGIVGDAVLLPEYLADRLPLAGRGMAIFDVRISRDGEPVHEVLRPAGLPDVVGAGAELVLRLGRLHRGRCGETRQYAGHSSVFVGQIHAGQIYNQSPVECRLSGTRRWVEPGQAAAVRAELEQLAKTLAQDTGTRVEMGFDLAGEAFAIDLEDPLVHAFQAAQVALGGAPLPPGGKPFVDDGNTFAGLAHIPALTHGPAARGAHTVEERVPVAELVRVAQVYALTAAAYCPG